MDSAHRLSLIPFLHVQSPMFYDRCSVTGGSGSEDDDDDVKQPPNAVHDVRGGVGGRDVLLFVRAGGQPQGARYSRDPYEYALSTLVCPNGHPISVQFCFVNST